MKKEYYNLHISLFRFNSKTDYLPCYKKYTIVYNPKQTLYDILNDLFEKEKFKYEEKEKCYLQVNKYFVNANQSIKDIVDKFGDELVFEPISIYRATNDLIIDTKDYEEKLRLFEKYMNIEQKKIYEKKFILEYYASNSININRNYIGNHNLLIAYDLIKNNKTIQNEIVKILLDKNNGIWYQTSLKNRLFNYSLSNEERYKKLVDICIPNSYEKNKYFLDKEDCSIEIKTSFLGFNIAVYQGTQDISFENIIAKSNGTYIFINSRFHDLALSSLEVNSNFSLKIAGEILLDAKDSNVDFLIVNDMQSFEIFDKNQEEIQKIVGRDINIPIIRSQQFYMLLKGEKDIKKLGFDKHKVKVNFIN